MLASEKGQKSWSEAIKTIGQCPICKEKYQPDKAQLFAKKEAANLVHITCTKCSAHFIAMIVMSGAGVGSIGVITDLSCEDAKQIYQLEPITIDEVIAGYEYINNNF